MSFWAASMLSSLAWFFVFVPRTDLARQRVGHHQLRRIEAVANQRQRPIADVVGLHVAVQVIDQAAELLVVVVFQALHALIRQLDDAGQV